MSQQQQYAQPTGPPPRQRHTARNILIALGIVFILALGGCLALVGGVAHQMNEVHTVVYAVTGTAGAADLTYTTDGSTSMEQITGASLPWTKTLKIQGGFIYQVLAQNVGPGGTVTCSITVDGQQVKTATGTGAATIASCDYTPA